MMAVWEAREVGMDEFRSAYERLASPEMNMLYECNYHPPLTSSVEMADIAGFYRAFGVDFSGDRPDHISLELEFMRLLAAKEAKALLDRDGEKGEICVSAEKSFLSSHAGRWASTLSRMTEGIPLYGSLGRFLHDWITMECRHFSVDVDEIFYSRSGKDEGPEHCLKEVRHEGI
jgi:TorA maturation chaperone TorD